VISNSSAEVEAAMSNYAMHLGSAFQLVDDLLDYSESSESIGKNIGDDLAEGKPTLPLLYAMRHGNAEQVKLIRDAIEHSNGMEHLDAILAALNETNALEFTMDKANEEAEKAIACLAILDESPYKEALISLARIAVDRSN